MHISHQQEQFSRAFVHAVTSAAGYRIQPGPQPDDDSVDLTICDRGLVGVRRSSKVDVQLKCWMGEMPEADFSYALPVKNYRELSYPRHESDVRRILVVVVVPRLAEDWVIQSPEHLILRHCAFWTCLHGLPATNNQVSVTIMMPRANTFTPASLTAMMARIGDGGDP